jgi:hypothetical protein
MTFPTLVTAESEYKRFRWLSCGDIPTTAGRSLVRPVLFNFLERNTMPPENYFWFHKYLPEFLEKLGFERISGMDYGHKLTKYQITFDFSETLTYDEAMQEIFSRLIAYGKAAKLSEIQNVLGIRT